MKSTKNARLDFPSRVWRQDARLVRLVHHGLGDDLGCRRHTRLGSNCRPVLIMLRSRTASTQEPTPRYFPLPQKTARCAHRGWRSPASRYWPARSFGATAQPPPPQRHPNWRWVRRPESALAEVTRPAPAPHVRPTHPTTARACAAPNHQHPTPPKPAKFGSALQPARRPTAPWQVVMHRQGWTQLQFLRQKSDAGRTPPIQR
jgi:hypothetical protein